MLKAAPAVGIIDDDVSTREALTHLLRSESIRTETYSSAREFLDCGPTPSFACLIVDVFLPGLSGLDLQQELAQAGVRIPIIFLTGNGDIPMSVQAMKAGALEFFTKPFNVDELMNAVRQAVALQSDVREHFVTPGEGSLIGESAALRAVIQQIDLVAETGATVLISGETGTGKELVASAIHERSARSDRSLIKVNCGAIPDSLLESEFFGHVKGAFTGALYDRTGHFELAEGGTLFLDEIGEVPLSHQAKLLRAIQEQEITRVGDKQSRRLNIRIIAATNRNLAAETKAGRFRADLYYRLNVFPIEVPPLRDRREDIPSLAEHFIQSAAGRLNHAAPRLTDALARQLSEHDWPGNIRELRNVVERAVILSRRGHLQFDTPVSCTSPSSDPGDEPNHRVLTREELKQRERESISAALARTNGRVGGPNGAAALLKMKVTTLHSRILALDLHKNRAEVPRGAQGTH